ncbi:hypothetical protein CFC21_082060 [Triticum aestivum]|uniref:Uncharacterized protein n=2 Tax=Triticum aestivum TaxID=4565 RepID=A0A3B6NKN0_WHEAT|nr:hypothetical protein CFC21_082060 [Triticum aestivum]
MAAAAREGEFSERELEVAAILADLPSIVRACNRRRRQQEKQQQQARPEIPSWGRRRPRRAVAGPPAGKPEAAGDDGRSEGVASPDTPLAFPEDDEHAEAAAAAATEDAAKACAQDKVSRRAARSAPARLPPPVQPASIPISCSSLTCSSSSSASVQWAQEQRGVVASLSHENAHLLKQIEDFRARLHTSRSTNDSLKQIHQSKHKKRHRPEEEDEGQRRWKLQPRAADRPALDLNEPAEADAEEGRPPQTAALAAAQWVHRGHQHQQQQQQQLMQMQHKAARRRRQEIRRAKAAAGRARRQG